MTVLGYVVGILLVIGMGLFAICSFIIANEIDKDIVRYVDKSNIEEHLIFLEKNRNLYEK